MGTLNKYILKQVLISSLLTVGLFVFVLVLGNVMKQVIGELASGKLSFEFFLKIVGLIIPAVIPYALPMGTKVPSAWVRSTCPSTRRS